MKSRPILFSAPMVRAILEGKKTQTRRVVKFPVKDRNNSGCEIAGCELNSMLRQEQAQKAGSFLCPYGQHGDTLWVKETFRLTTTDDCACYEPCNCKVGLPVYRATMPDDDLRWTPSIFMPRWASRITLEIVSVRVERLQDITEDDAEAEGALIGFDEHPEPPAASAQYRRIWEQINGNGSWDLNPWVWVITFKQIANSDSQDRAGCFCL